MDKRRVLLLFVIAATVITLCEAVAKRDHNDYTKNPRRLVCYFGSWANYHNITPFKIENIDNTMCTHIMYGFAKINEFSYKIEVFDPYLDDKQNAWDLRAYERFNNLRKQNPQLTTMIALGGWYEGSEKYSDMARNPTLRHSFVKSVIEFLQEHDFDGMDLDWEYPGNRGGRAVDKDNYILLLQELREAFDQHGYVLTAAVSAGKPTMERAYKDISALNKYLDFYQVMSYDYHGGWEDRLGHNAPLHPRPEDINDPLNSIFNIEYSINYWISLGGDKGKMVMGMPLYGRAWTINNTERVFFNDSAVEMSPPGFISGESGVLGYNEFCEIYKNYTSEWTIKYDPYYKAPYAYNKTIWLGFDNERSLACKVSFLKKMGLSGGMIWSMETDDFSGRCGNKYPLLHKVHSLLNGAQKDVYECDIADEETTHAPTTQSPTTPSPTTSPTTPSPTTPSPTTPSPTTESPTQPPTSLTPSPTTPSPTPTPVTTEYTTQITIGPNTNYTVKCVKQGYQPHPSDPHKFIECLYVGGKWEIYIMDCSPGTRWHQGIENCIAEEQ